MFEVIKYGIILYIDSLVHTLGQEPIFIDIETDEKDNFVGISLCNKKNEVFYFTSLSAVKTILENRQLSGHNIKGDIHWLRKWGINIKPAQIKDDTMIMSYVLNPVKESHALKNLGQELLGLHWPTYKEMTHPNGGKKVTLDALPVEEVANYCGMDAIASYRLASILSKKFSPVQKEIYENLEMPINRLLFSMEQMGLFIDVKYLAELKEKFSVQISCLEQELNQTGLSNPRSSQQIIDICNKMEMYPRAFNTRTHRVSNSASKSALLKYKDNDFIKTLLEHKKISKLYNGYIKRYTELTKNGEIKVYPSISQISIAKNNEDQEGIKTGRLASDFHNIPRRSETGALLRKLFIAKEGYSIICGDYSQIEYRLLAHFSHEPVLLEAYRQGLDVHSATASLLGVKDRDLGKTFNFAAIYGAQPKRISQTAGISEKEAEAILKTYWAKLPNVTKWITLVREKAKKDGYITTLHGWQIPIPGIHSSNPWERMSAERQAVNYVIQGSAAYIIKKAMLECVKTGLPPILQCHDETLTEVKTPEALEARNKIKEIMENIITLEVPLSLDIGIGQNWSEAKNDAS